MIFDKILDRFKNKDNCVSFVDEVSFFKERYRLWKMVSTLLFFVCSGLSVAILGMAYFTINKIEETKYILAPGITELTDAYPGVVTYRYIEGIFTHVAEKLGTWDSDSFGDNMDILYRFLFTPQLALIQKENLRINKFEERIKNKKVLSVFNIDKERSSFEWCGKSQVPCGVVVGTESVYQDGYPYKKEDVAYFMVGTSTIPNRTEHTFAIKIARIVRTTEGHAKTLLEAAKKGEFPSEDVSDIN